MKKTKPIAATLSILAATSLVILAGGAITWTGDTQLTSHLRWDGLPTVTQASDGKIWVVWVSDRSGPLPGDNWDIFYKKYNGTSWSLDTVLIGGMSTDDEPSMIRASDGTLWLVWTSDRGGNDDIFYKTSSNNGTTWSVERQLTLSTSSDNNPSIGQAKDGTIWVVWNRDVDVNVEIFYRTYSPSTGTWTTEKQLTNELTVSRSPSVAQAADGKIWVVWHASIGGNFDIYAKTTSDNGATWSDKRRLTTSNDMDTDPAILRTIYGKLWIIWSNKKSTPTAYYDLWYITSSDNGATWSSPIQFTTDKWDDMYPSITQSFDRKLWIVWASTRVGQPDGNIEIFYKTTIPVMGDVNEDWVVDAFDLAIVSKAYGSHKGDPDYDPAADLNNDNLIDLWDLTLLAINWGKTG